MDIFKLFSTNKQREMEGVKVDMDDAGSFVRVARDNNEKFQKKARRLFKPHRALIQQGKLPDEMARRLSCEAMSGTVLLDWGGPLFAPTGPYTDKAAENMLFELPDFSDWIAGLAKDPGTFKDEEAEDLETKNSAPGTPGT